MHSSLPRDFKRPKKLSIKYSKIIGPNETPIVEDLLSKNPYPIKIFGERNVEELLCTSLYSLGINNREETMVGAMCVNDYPNVPSVPKWDWEGWLHNMYGLEDVNSRNSLWIHLLAYTREYTFQFLEPLLQYLFRRMYYLEYLLVVLPPGLGRMDILESKATKVLPKGYSLAKHVQIIYVLTRQYFVSNYQIRRAVEEDNDDLVALIDYYSKNVKELYGEFYIAELVTYSQACGRQLVVAEYQGRAIGILCVNKYVNYDLLNEEFELAPFNAFRKSHKEDVYHHRRTPQRETEKSVFENFMERDEYIEYPDKIRLSEDKFIDVVKTTSSEDFIIVLTSSSIYSFEEYSEASDEGILEECPAKLTMFTRFLNDQEKNLNRGIEIDPHKQCVRRVIFRGKENAFTIELVAIHPDHEECLVLLFQSMFGCFPDRNFGILSKPTDSGSLKFTNLFVRVPLKADGAFSGALYVVSRDSIGGVVKVVPAVANHKREMDEFIYSVEDCELVYSRYINYFSDKHTKYQVFLFLCDERIGGLAILSEERNIDYLLKNYHVHRWSHPKLFKTGNYGVVEYCLMSLGFLNHGTYFLKELHRQADYDILFYKITSSLNTKKAQRGPINNLLTYFLPVEPRNQAQFDISLDDSFVEHELEQEPLALFISTVKICFMLRCHISHQIVVIGASLTALAFMEALYWQRNTHFRLSFENILLVDIHGYNIKVPKAISEFLIKKTISEYRLMDMLYLKTFVNVVQGVLTGIDRKQKMITINDTTFLPYDLLFLTCGEQFQKPIASKFKEYPANVFVINNGVDAAQSIIDLKELIKTVPTENVKIIVYGYYLQCYSCLAMLLEYGISGGDLVLIQPYPHNWLMEGKHTQNISMFNNEEIEKAVIRHLTNLGIRIYESYYFLAWTYHPAQKLIVSAKFESHSHLLNVPCTAMFIFHNRCISPKTFHAIINAGLVFDGRLVIDSNFKTNDDYIYAAGTLTKYSRKYYASYLIHKYYNREEIGEVLGQRIKKTLTPNELRRYEFIPEDKIIGKMDCDNLVPKFTQPVVRYTRLPGNLYYSTVLMPGLQTPLQIREIRQKMGTVLYTGNPQDVLRQGYFRIVLNELNVVEGITCLTKFPYNMNILVSLYGKHEHLLNNLLLRFQMGMIEDFFDFFKKPWASALYTDDFNKFNENLTHFTMELKDPKSGKNLLEQLIESNSLNNWKELPEATLNEIKQTYITEAITEQLTEKLMNYLQKYATELPVYAIPSLIELLLSSHETSPMF